MSVDQNRTRRLFLKSSAPLAVGASGSLASILSFAQAPALVSLEASRPKMHHGVQSGDTSGGSGMVWSRCDRDSKMWVQWDTVE